MSENDPEWLLNQVQNQLDSDWEEYREIKHGSKGTQYEKTLKGFLDQYYGNIYDIKIKTSLIDPEKKAFDIFDFSGDDEFDVVGTFRQANPRIVFETGEAPNQLHWVPYICVAFVCEVKSQLTKQSLEGDLEKLSNLSELDQTIEDRFGLNLSGEYTIEEPLKCLIYDRESISEDSLNELLLEHLEDWHLLLIVENDTIILNSKLPMAQSLVPSSDSFGPADLDEPLPEEALAEIEDAYGIDTDPAILTTDRGLLNFITAIAVSVPDPLSISTIDTILSMTQGATTTSGAKKDIGKTEPEN